MENATVSFAVQVALLSAAVPLNAGILVISLRRDLFIQDNLKYFIANLAVLDIAASLWLVRFLWSYATAPDNLVFLEVIYRCWLIYALLATIMGLLPLTLLTHIAAHWPKQGSQLFSKAKCICYCYIVDLIPLVSYVLIAHTCYTALLCNVTSTTYSLFSIAFVILILSSYISYKTISAKLKRLTNAGDNRVEIHGGRRDSNSRSSDYATGSLSIKPQLQLTSDVATSRSGKLFLEQDSLVYSAKTNGRWMKSKSHPPKHTSNAQKTALLSVPRSNDELARLKEAQKVALFSTLHIIKPFIVFLPRVINLFVNAIIVPSVARDSDYIGKSRFLFYSDFFTNELLTTIFCAQPFVDATITLYLMRQYHKTAVRVIKKCAIKLSDIRSSDKIVSYKTTV